MIDEMHFDLASDVNKINSKFSAEGNHRKLYKRGLGPHKLVMIYVVAEFVIGLLHSRENNRIVCANSECYSNMSRTATFLNCLRRRVFSEDDVMCHTPKS
jgi:hypothetical protein